MVNLNAMVPVLFYLLQFLLIVRVCEEDEVCGGGDDK